mmetsp:Transcript_44236/g.70710  ORF Transcript_44236/g.70710 Transcript_44236/m.70710 type:complete len:427 (-) Transcript_44236:313-1593(-)|eukprot:CAMPEP_0203750252 /NCGR_PEP_ID=MMETSP0098-20131031/4511_1 /ASSEMBLY_ACC=CAM_ASM_000208 /TAXON_ID=96639 /ORGANISM=" , Strain NY0313808BC1" /LENGTH=426 /DNA_ID=CAMNT_0050639463 /DNA_START=318 /DNA_END=1598 /DNA_ORIENTATION=+
MIRAALCSNLLPFLFVAVALATICANAVFRYVYSNGAVERLNFEIIEQRPPLIRDDLRLEDDQVAEEENVFEPEPEPKTRPRKVERFNKSEAHFNKSDLHSYYTDKFETYDCNKYLHKSQGSLPQFLVAGTHKGGSTALYGYLIKHGHIRPSSCKETRFFNDRTKWKQGLSFYRRHFPKVVNGVLTGEGTPSYIRDPVALRRIHRTIPNAKIIVSLRDPAERFISHFVGFVERGLTKLTCKKFWESMLDQLRRCELEYEPMSHRETFRPGLGVNELRQLELGIKGVAIDKYIDNSTDVSCPLKDTQCIKRYCYAIHHENAIVRSLYSDQIVRWLGYYPKHQMSIVRSETLFKDTNTSMQNLTAFLNLRPFTTRELESFKDAKKGSSHHKDPLYKTCNRTEIRAFFTPENELLRLLISAQWGVDISW